ncbi:TetR/AcrR family transcriptional regulator [Dongia sp.]|uniref:TetR/AcrR family transcriptional regulator n=1 Tax=Dongia sp. TaxID=1977262 RepID=UPI0035B473D9
MARRIPEKRSYRQTRRAEQTADTRRRIVDAAVQLHSTVGPARSTLSMIAEKAGVQRHTLYAHFPDERSLLMACSGETMARDPFPDAAPWRNIAPGLPRLKQGLIEIYDWYRRNASLAACVLRDAESHDLVREISDLRWGPRLALVIEVLSEGLNQKQMPLLRLAISFHTWRSLVQESGLDTRQAAETGAAMLTKRA